MTHSSDFKQLVRARMRATGQNYTAARADLLREHDAAAPPTAHTSPRDAGQSAAPAAPTSDSRASELASPVTVTSGPDHPLPSATSTAPDAPGAAQDEWDRAQAEYRRVLGRFLRDGRVVDVPARRRVRVFVLLHLLSLFPAGRTWTEPEVNEILLTVVEDQAFWRRELVEYGYLQREAGIYWLPERAPERPPHMRQEFPAWERVWLPTHLSGRAS